MNHGEATKIMDSIQKAYDKVVTPFVASRARDWSEFQKITSLCSSTDRILDIGCAHGRLLPVLIKEGIKEDNYTGIDLSEKLIEEAKKTFPGARFDVGNACRLPYQNEAFDITISSAVLHHIPSDRLRISAVQEMLRVTKSGGTVVILVWNAFYFKHLWPHILRSLIPKKGGDMFDMYLPFFGKDTIRYVHAFTQHSLRKLLKKSGVKYFSLEKTGKNFFIVIQK